MSSTKILNQVAALYVEAGQERWGDQYDIVLGGGYLNTRAPYDLAAGEVTYGDLMNVLPFDNRLALCSITGANLKSRFINNSSYYIAYSDYGAGLTISDTKTYYVIVDTYSAYYASNKLTVIELYDEDVYARDLLAEYFRENY
jgi:2',3'-cyclic-nucleotide 2'-phosphodiesterase (5'-nucleotidase family)